MVPVDLVVNGLICAAKETAAKYENAKLSKKLVSTRYANESR